MRVIPNWVDTGTLVPQPRVNAWGEEKGLADRFVVMHSGNVGHAQNLDALVRAATFLRDLDDLTIAIVGNGARHDALVELAELLEVGDVVRFWPYQPRELLPQSLSSADVHVVGLARGLSGYVVPSRLYGILSVGRPVIVAADRESETAQLVEQVGCGVVVPPGGPELLAEAIRAAHDGELDLGGDGRPRPRVRRRERRPRGRRGPVPRPPARARRGGGLKMPRRRWLVRGRPRRRRAARADPGRPLGARPARPARARGDPGRAGRDRPARPAARSTPTGSGVGPGMDCLLYKRGSNPFALEFCFDGAGRVIEAIDRTRRSARASGASARIRRRRPSASTGRSSSP